jgi:Cytochrome P460
MRKMLLVLVLGLIAAFLASRSIPRPATPSAGDGPQFTADGQLVRPADYRRWIYVSSGFGMSYTQRPEDMQMFTNVFVKPAAYDYYLANGKWPDKTMFVLEIYGSTSQGSINKHGSYQKDFAGLDVEVKDEARFADKWAYFNFDGGEKTAGAIAPGQNACWKCHEQNAAVEHSFVQFYPELLKVAKAKNTIKRAYTGNNRPPRSRGCAAIRSESEQTDC